MRPLNLGPLHDKNNDDDDDEEEEEEEEERRRMIILMNSETPSLELRPWNPGSSYDSM